MSRNGVVVIGGPTDSRTVGTPQNPRAYQTVTVGSDVQTDCLFSTCEKSHQTGRRSLRSRTRPVSLSGIRIKSPGIPDQKFRRSIGPNHGGVDTTGRSHPGGHSLPRRRTGSYLYRRKDLFTEGVTVRSETSGTVQNRYPTPFFWRLLIYHLFGFSCRSPGPHSLHHHWGLPMTPSLWNPVPPPLKTSSVLRVLSHSSTGFLRHTSL